MSEGKQTKLVTAGRDKKWTNGVVNPPIQRASTVVFDTVADKNHAAVNRANKTLFYGRRGTHTHFAFQEAMTQIEGGAGCALYPCGTAAISNAILSFVETGDHILMVDTCYEPTRDFCDKIMKKMGVETTYYDPMVGEGICELIKPNTKVLFLESPALLRWKCKMSLPSHVLRMSTESSSCSTILGGPVSTSRLSSMV